MQLLTIKIQYLKAGGPPIKTHCNPVSEVAVKVCTARGDSTTTVCPVHNFPPPSELLVCYQPHRQTVMPGQKSIYETLLVVNHPLQALVLLQDYLITGTKQLGIVTNQ
jgi:hypothetical protein